MTVVSFTDYLPPPRYDAASWTQARIEEATAQAGPWTVIDTRPLTPDADPTNPASRSFTTELATLTEGWYRVTWLDAQGDASAPTEPAHNVAGPQIRPTVAEVAILLRTRTVGESSGGLGGDTSPADVTTFTSETRPAAAEVEAVIDQAVEAITAQLPPNIPALYYAQTRHNVALYAAILIEGSFFRESLDEGSVDLYRDLLRTGMPTLATAIDEENAETTGEGFASVVVRSATVAAAYPYLPLVP